MYAFFALCFTRTNDRWSIDYYVNRWRGKQADRAKSESILDTGIARKLVLVSVAGFYFAAGYAKPSTSPSP